MQNAAQSLEIFILGSMKLAGICFSLLKRQKVLTNNLNISNPEHNIEQFPRVSDVTFA